MAPKLAPSYKTFLKDASTSWSDQEEDETSYNFTHAEKTAGKSQLFINIFDPLIILIAYILIAFLY